MRIARNLPAFIGLIGCLGLLTGLQDPLNNAQAFAAQLVSDEQLQAMEAVHKRNIGQLHGLHHDMRVTLKQVTRGRNDQEATQQLAAQLQAVKQTLDKVAATEQNHPQWARSWSQRHARLAVLTQEMGSILTRAGSRDGSRSIDHIGKKLQEMKEILDIW